MTHFPAHLDLPESHVRALTCLFDKMPPSQFTWALTGSAGLRIQGVDVPVHDLDIQTDQETIFILEGKLAGFMKTPVHVWESPGMRSLDGKAEVEGIEIELLANIAHRLPDGSWSSFTDFSRLIHVELGGLVIPVFPLEDELEAYKAMGRSQKAALIRETIVWLQAGK